MNIKYTDSEKSIITARYGDGESVADLVRDTQIPRSTIYAWIKEAAVGGSNNCTFLDVSPITLEDGVWLGANVTLATPSHPFLSEERLPQEYPDGFHDLEYSKPITIKKNCWICSSATIVGGVTVGENSIVAAGAVVTKDVPANSIVAGVPAKVIRSIDEEDRVDVWETYVKNEIPMSVRDMNN